MTKPTAAEIKAALDREVAAMKARGTEVEPGDMWDIDLRAMSKDEIEAYAIRLCEGRTLPTDPKMVRKERVDRSVVIRRAGAK